MSAAHTPGPWAFGSFSKLKVVPVINGVIDKYWCIADLGETSYPYNKTEDSNQRYANAALIAAAPDLLEALRNLLKVHEGEGGTTYHAGDIARAAIAKATGAPA